MRPALYSPNDFDLSVFMHELETKSLNGPQFDSFLKGLQNKGFQKDSVNMKFCRQRSVHLNNGEFGLTVKQTCDNRFCPHCSKLRALKQNKALRKFFSEAKSNLQANRMRFVTLTYKNVHSKDDLQKCLKSISKDLTKFKNTLKRFGYFITAGYRVLEITHSDETGYHPHLHLLYFADQSKTKEQVKAYNKFKVKNDVLSNKGSYIEFDEAFPYNDGFIHFKVLNKIWEYSNHSDSNVTKPVQFRIQRIGAGINYICKYMTKGFYDDSFDLNVSIDLYTATNRIRFIQKFGTGFQGLKVKDLTKVSIYYKDDVHVIGRTTKGFPIYAPINDHVSPFVYGFDYECIPIENEEVRYCEI